MKSTTDRVLTIVFATLIAVNMFYLLVGFLSMPVFYDRITSLTIQPRDMPGASVQSNESVVQRAEAQGLSLAQFAAGQIAFHSAMVFVFLGVAALIMLRAGWNWFAWYSAFFLVFIAEYVLFDEIYIARLMPILVYEAGSLLWPLILLYFFLFPNGKPVPRWALWVVLPAFVLHIIFQTTAYIFLLLPSSEIWKQFESVVGVFQTFIILIFIFILGCQIYRYLRVSNPEEKQQTKWFIMGFIFFLALSTINDALGASNPYHSEINLLIFAFVPISLGIAILRYRLWDIDLVIRRTLVYSLLTAILGLTYFGSVVLLQNIVASESGQPTTISIVLTTLLIAALFSPLRRRLQDFIDRRFYRQKYDAEKALAGFATLARNETDLETLSTSMLQIVQATMHPKNSLIWMRPDARVQVKDQEDL